LILFIDRSNYKAYMYYQRSCEIVEMSYSLISCLIPLCYYNLCHYSFFFFSDIPSKCDGYVGGPEKLMYACKVILGCVKVYPKSRSDPQLTREPPKKHPLGSYYDSVKVRSCIIVVVVD
jgi:hypothetical protein